MEPGARDDHALTPAHEAQAREAQAHEAQARETPAGLRVRPVTDADLEDVTAMIADFARGHPAEHHPRPIERLRAVVLGDGAIAHLLIAERRGRVVGMVQWTLVFDLFWSMYGGAVDWLYVRREVRGLGISAALVARACAEIRRAGGEFLRGGGGDDVARLYDRVAIGAPAREHHLSAEAFQAFADLAGAAPREIVRNLPARELNRVPPRLRP